jgi:putative tryptophan/tyrosine transport system ATP-binding protein
MLQCQNLYKTFHPDNNPLNDKKALQGVSLTIGDDDFIAVIGGNGSGKTTLLNCIAGVHRPDKGSMILDGINLRDYKEHQRAKWIGRVFQDPMQGTIADISLFENLALAAKRAEKPSPFRWALSKKKKEEFVALLKPLGLGLEDRLDAKIGSFSGGQRQSVTLLMATLAKPKLLLLDEHTAALDPKTAKTVMELTDKIVKENHIPTLMITHNMKDAIKYGNRLIMMNAGKIIYEAAGKEKQKLTVEDLVAKFQKAGDEDLPDAMVLS